MHFSALYSAKLREASEGAEGVTRSPQLPAARLHCEHWAGAAPDPSAPLDSLLQPLGRALHVDVSVGAPSLGPWGLGGAPSVDFLVLDGARSYDYLLADLRALAGSVKRFIGIPHSEYTPSPTQGAPDVHAAGVKAALFDFLFRFNGTAEWEVSAHFPNNGGFILLSHKSKSG